jgi:protein-S-isoprenylcysteine O-methyltransferase Ste14
MSKGARVNVLVDLVIAISFLLAAASGIYFLFDVRSGWQVTSTAPLFLWSRTTWDLIHTWSGVTLIVAAIVHLAIHWGWVTKVTAKMWRSVRSRTDSPVSTTA